MLKRFRANEVCAWIRENLCNSWLILSHHAAGVKNPRKSRYPGCYSYRFGFS